VDLLWVSQHRLYKKKICKIESMSFANYLQTYNGSGKQATFSNVVINTDPEELDDAPRLGDTLLYSGNATYPLITTTQSVPYTQNDFVPLFETGQAENDYLRVKSDLVNPNYAQLANVEYSLFITGCSLSNFDFRYAVYDEDLSRVKVYDTLSWSPFENSTQPTSLSKIILKGMSVDYPDNAVFGFVEVSVPPDNTSGSVAFQFDYAYSQLENAVDTSIEAGAVGSRSSLDIFVADYGDLVIDASGIEPQIQALQADVDALDTQVPLNTAKIADVSNQVDTNTANISNKVDITGDTMTGALQFGSAGASSIRFAPADATHQAQVSADTIQTALAVQHNTEIYMSQYNGGANKKVVFNMTNGDITTPGQVASAGFSSIGGSCSIQGASLNMNNQKIVNVASPSNPNEVATKTYVDNRPVLALAGGTMAGSIAMGGSRITNMGTPTQPTDAATKSYVDATGGDGDLASILSRGNNADGQNIVDIGGLTCEGKINAPEIRINALNASNEITIDGTALANGADIPKMNTSSLLLNGNLIMGLTNGIVHSQTKVVPFTAGGQVYNYTYPSSFITLFQPQAGVGGVCFVNLPVNNGVDVSDGALIFVRNIGNPGAANVIFRNGGNPASSVMILGGVNANFSNQGGRWAILMYVAQFNTWLPLAYGSDGWSGTFNT